MKLSTIKHELENEVKQIAENYPKIDTRVEVRNGHFYDEIDVFAKSHEVKLIIAGVRKVNGLQKVIFEGKASKFLRHLHTPIVVIPEGYVYKPIEKIMFASDFKPIKNDNALDILVEIAKIRSVEVRIAHVRTEKCHLNEEGIMEMHRESSLFGDDVKHSFKHIHRFTVSKGIDYYLRLKGDNDLLLLIKREKGFMGRTFSHDHALEFALHPELPILIIDENG